MTLETVSKDRRSKGWGYEVDGRPSGEGEKQGF